ncbi:nitronate monooxygenase family protein [Nevskia sp.]|uniref:NAD(P)H-dependent flavin oxidoreductase n=1 Tax=Nevskia sp. TaxID=1929292 RepID=UPI0025D9DABB|nr:nitronate monooxygenase family protein [Nevskia sp.]
MALPAVLQNLRLPVICSPMFIASNPRLVIEQCKAGVVGSFPALNARPQSRLGEWLVEIETALAAFEAANPGKKAAPFAVNQIVHKSNDRLEADMATCVEHKVPIIITSLRAPDAIVPAVHSYGGLVFHDVISVRHAQKALEAGVDGLILVCAGAGGHAGTLSPFALVGEIRKFYQGPIILSGSIASGDAILSAQAMGADIAYIGTRWLATPEANVSEGYRQAIVESGAGDIVYTPYFSGVHGNYLKKSIVLAGMDPDNLPHADASKMNLGSGGAEADSSTAKAWKDIWGAGQGVGLIDAIKPTAEVVNQLEAEYRAAKARMLAATAAYTD